MLPLHRSFLLSSPIPLLHFTRSKLHQHQYYGAFLGDTVLFCSVSALSAGGFWRSPNTASVTLVQGSTLSSWPLQRSWCACFMRPHTLWIFREFSIHPAYLGCHQPIARFGSNNLSFFFTCLLESKCHSTAPLPPAPPPLPDVLPPQRQGLRLAVALLHPARHGTARHGKPRGSPPLIPEPASPNPSSFPPSLPPYLPPSVPSLHPSFPALLLSLQCQAVWAGRQRTEGRPGASLLEQAALLPSFVLLFTAHARVTLSNWFTRNWGCNSSTFPVLLHLPQCL